MIKAGQVKVNGKAVTVLGTKIDPDKDRVQINGRVIKLKSLVYIALNKPKKYVTTRHDPQKRKTVFDLLPPEMRNAVWPIGRLDYMTEGLLIFSNDGSLTQILTHPSKEHEKEYQVVLDKAISEGKLEKVRAGIKLGKKVTSPAKVWLVADNVVGMIIHEGWNRQIKRMFSVIGLTVRELKRIRVGKFKLKNLPLGQWVAIKKEDVV
jgi:23S rRNA pseudouridine2605 synthase